MELDARNPMDDAVPVLVLTTWPADRDAAPLAATLVEERLAACVSLLPEMDSTYTWEGRLERQRERQVVIKTTSPRLAALSARLVALHPYEVPELLVLRSVSGSAAYIDWLRSATDSTPGGEQS